MEKTQEVEKPELVELGSGKAETRDGFPLKERFDSIRWTPYCW
jgi:hypothetical protein